jgi:hypothetical protein
MGDDQLLSRLGACLTSDARPPDPDGRAAMHAALQDGPSLSPLSSPPRVGARWGRLRRPVAAGIAATILLSGGAAAAVETDTLPGPLRDWAVTIGLPVTPSALMRAQSALSDLTHALAVRDPAAVRADLATLRAALNVLDANDRAALGPATTGLIAEAEIFLAGEAPSPSDPGAGGSTSGGPNATSGAAGDSSAGEGHSGQGQTSGGSGSANTGGSDGGNVATSDDATGSLTQPSSASTEPADGDDGGSASTSTTGSSSTSVTSSDGGSSSGGTSTSGGSTSMSISGSDGSGGSTGTDGGSSGTDGGGSLSGDGSSMVTS